MIITDEMIHQTMIKNGTAYVIAGLVFLIGGILFGVFFERERRQVVDVRDRKARLILHSVTATLVLIGLWLTLMLGARWLVNADSYNVYETTVVEKHKSSFKKRSRKHHIRYQVYFDGISAVQVFRPVRKAEYDAIEVGDRALVVDGVGNSYLKVWYGEDDVYEGTHLVDIE